MALTRNRATQVLPTTDRRPVRRTIAITVALLAVVIVAALFAAYVMVSE